MQETKTNVNVTLTHYGGDTITDAFNLRIPCGLPQGYPIMVWGVLDRWILCYDCNVVGKREDSGEIHRNTR